MWIRDQERSIALFLFSLSCFCASLIKLLGFLGKKRKKRSRRGGSKSSSPPPSFFISFCFFLISLIISEVESYWWRRWYYQEPNASLKVVPMLVVYNPTHISLVKPRASFCFSCAAFVRKHQWRKKRVIKSPSPSSHIWRFAPSLVFFQTKSQWAILCFVTSPWTDALYLWRRMGVISCHDKRILSLSYHSTSIPSDLSRTPKLDHKEHVPSIPYLSLSLYISFLFRLF